MPVPVVHAEQLLKAATKGEKLTTDQRRYAVGYLMATQPEVAVIDMAQTFGVSERTIREDRLIIRRQVADVVRQDDIGLVIADIRLTYERLVDELAKSKKKCEAGTRVYLDHLRAEWDMQKEVIEALQSLGYYPKNLGNMTSTKYEFKAHVTKDGSVDVRPVDMVIDVEDAKKREALEAEFIDIPQLPAPADNDGGTETNSTGINQTERTTEGTSTN